MDVHWTPFEDRSHLQWPNEGVRVFTDRSAVKQDYREIGMITVTNIDSYSLALDAIREKAGTVGADAVIVQSPEVETSALVPIKGVIGLAKDNTYRAVAIVFE